MPRLEDSTEYKNAARLAKVGPETWRSWVGALEGIRDAFLEVTKDAPVGSLLRAGGVGVPPTNRSFNEQIKEDVINYGIPQAGVIKGLKGALRKGSQLAPSVRKTIAQERATRSTGEGDWFSRLLRGTPYHGGGYELYPQLGEHFNPKLFSTGKVGEPNGMSVTYDPDMYRRHNTFAKAPQKYTKAENNLRTLINQLDAGKKDAQMRLKQVEQTNPELAKQLTQHFSKLYSAQINAEEKLSLLKSKSQRGKKPFARVFPFFRDKPESVVVKGWKGGGDDDLLKQAYEYAVQQTPEIWTQQKMIPKETVSQYVNASGNSLDYYTSLANDLSNNPNLYSYAHEAATKAQSGAAIDEATLGNLSSLLPVRISVALSNPTNPAYKKTLNRFIDTVRMIQVDKTIPQGLKVPAREYVPDYSHIASILETDTSLRNKFNSHLTQYLQSQGKQALLYMPQRYDEWELRVFDPRDVMMLDIRKPQDPAFKRAFETKKGQDSTGFPTRKRPPRAQTLRDWELAGATSGISTHHQAGLGRIYEDIDLQSIQKWSPQVASSTAEEVKTKILADSISKRKEGLRLGSTEPSRLRRERPDPQTEAFFKANPSLASDPKAMLQENVTLGDYSILPDGDITDSLTGEVFAKGEFPYDPSLPWEAFDAKQALAQYLQKNQKFTDIPLGEIGKDPDVEFKAWMESLEPSIKIKPKTPKKKISLTPPEDDFIVDISDDPLFAKPPLKSKEKEWK